MPGASTHGSLQFVCPRREVVARCRQRHCPYDAARLRTDGRGDTREVWHVFVDLDGQLLRTHLLELCTQHGCIRNALRRYLV